MATFKEDQRKNKELLFELFARVGSALANPHRLEILDLLVQSPRTVEELASLAQMSVANTSQHLQRLKQARLVVDERDGQHIYYCLADAAIARLWIELRRVAERQLAEVERALDQYRSHRSAFQRISVEDLLSGLNRDEILLIDARPEVEFQAGHLPGAVSIPVQQLPARIDDLPDHKTLVAYCRGPYCVDADEALIILAAHGYTVKRLEEGVAEWHEAGLSIERMKVEE
ncbi:MAG TPA: metalloregulator ArsR/SmtB family transcription factor [Anaerolineaceae bacterium]|nr:metalloregulator ArsR/SmtB family transcription factor [Anaerolineaceae bacterium]